MNIIIIIAMNVVIWCIYHPYNNYTKMSLKMSENKPITFQIADYSLNVLSVMLHNHTCHDARVSGMCMAKVRTFVWSIAHNKGQAGHTKS